MAGSDRPLQFDFDFESATIRRLVAVLLGAAGVFFLSGLVAVLPGIDRLVATLLRSPHALLLAIATLLALCVLSWVGRLAGTVVEQAFDGHAVGSVAMSAKLLVAFAAVLVAYYGFAPAARPLLAAFGVGGLYDLGFLAVGLLVLGALARRLYRCWLPLTDLLTASVTGD